MALVHKSRILARLENTHLEGAELIRAKIDGDEVSTEKPVLLPGTSGISASREALIPRKIVFDIEDVELLVPAGDDYASVVLEDIPASEFSILGAVMDLAVVIDGMKDQQVKKLEMAIGTQPIASKSFSPKQARDIIDRADGVGETAEGTMKAAMADDTLGVVLPVEISKLYLNAQQLVNTGVGRIVANGTIFLIALDRGTPS